MFVSFFFIIVPNILFDDTNCEYKYIYYLIFYFNWK